MRRLILLLIGLSQTAYGAGPLFKHQDRFVEQEFENVYQDVRAGGTADPLSLSSSTVTNFTASISTVTNLTVSAGNIPSSAIIGTATNDSAPTGRIGEIVSGETAFTSVGTSGQWYDITSISLTAGDWDVSGGAFYVRNGATIANLNLLLGISTTSGNSSTGLTYGSNLFVLQPADLTTFGYLSLYVPTYRMSLSGTATVYLKGFIESYSAATPQHAARISARRVR